MFSPGPSSLRHLSATQSSPLFKKNYPMARSSVTMDARRQINVSHVSTAFSFRKQHFASRFCLSRRILRESSRGCSPGALCATPRWNRSTGLRELIRNCRLPRELGTAVKLREIFMAFAPLWAPDVLWVCLRARLEAHTALMRNTLRCVLLPRWKG